MRTRLLDLSERIDANSRGGGGLLSNTDECVEAMRPSSVYLYLRRKLHENVENHGGSLKHHVCIFRVSVSFHTYCYY